MSSLTLLRQFLNVRLSVAAEEIFGAVERIVLDLQNEVSSTKEDRERQRRLLDAVIKPDLKLHRIEPELPSPPVCEQVHSEQQEQSFNIIQDDPEPRQVKVENLWTSQEQGPFPGLDTTDSIAPPPCVEERDSENDAQVEVHPYHTPQLENSRCTNTEVDSGRGHVGFEANNDSQHHSAPVADGFTEEGQYECKVCGKRFKYRGSFKSHTLIHTGEKPYNCKECSASFRYRSHLNRHKMKHKGEAPFQCKDCGKGFTRKGNLTFHNERHCGEWPYQCKECSDCFQSKVCLNNHSRSHTIENTQSEGHSEQKPLERESDVCLVQNDPEPPQIKEEEDLWTIQEIREQFQGWDTTDSIAPPPRVEERGYVDDVNELMMANRICTDTDGEMYREHVGFEPNNESQHLSAPIPGGYTEEHQYECKVCGKRFKYRGSFKSHKLIHTGEKPYKCKECSSTFRYKGHLNRHKRVHTGEKPYVCELCGKSFTRKEKLTSHTEHQHLDLIKIT